jgi:hypothetical protein
MDSQFLIATWLQSSSSFISMLASLSVLLAVEVERLAYLLRIQ